MRQLWTAAVLLTVLAAGLLLLGRTVNGLASPMLADLTRASEAAQVGDWEAAQRLTRRTAEAWETAGSRLLLVENHQAVGEIAAELDEAVLAAEERDRGDLLVSVRRAVRALTALQDAERLSLGNVF
jgi:hypothetical protein